MALKRTLLVGGALVAALLAPTTANAASSKGCDGGGFTLRLGDGSSVKPDLKGTIAASRLGSTRIQAVGKYVTFEIDPTTFGVYDYAFTGAANPLDMTGGRRIVAFASKVPDHRGLTLTSGVDAELDKENLSLGRTGSGLSMKLQAKDCANGGVF